jgi:hypothetical protein
VNPDNLEFELSIAGYKNVKLADVPRKSRGVVELNFKVERDGEPAAASASTSPAGVPASDLVDHSYQAPSDAPAGEENSRSLRLIFMGIAGLTIIAAAVARTSGRGRSTAR